MASGDSAQVVVSARQADGRTLPAWLSFNPVSGRFEGSPPPGFSGELRIQVIARDSQGREARTVFTLRVGRPAQSSHLERGEPAFALSRPSLAEQFARHGRVQADARHHALLEHAARAARLKAG